MLRLEEKLDATLAALAAAGALPLSGGGMGGGAGGGAGGDGDAVGGAVDGGGGDEMAS